MPKTKSKKKDRATPTADAFLSCLASCTEACANMSLQDNDWMPPDGYYDVAVTGIANGTKEKNGVMNSWIRPTYQILDGEFEEREFGDYFWISPNAEEVSMPLRRLCQLATTISGREIRDPVDAAQVIMDAEGEGLNLQVFRSVGKKPPHKEYTNIRYMASLQATEETEVDTDTDEG